MGRPGPIPLALARVPSPIGTMLVVTDADHRVRALDWDDHESRLHQLLGRHYGPGGVALAEAPAPAPLHRALDAYFAGEVTAIDAIAVATGGTDFQRTVWSALRGIRAGETLSYHALAARIGRPAAIRAVGAANGANPIGIVVPCHRLIGADGALTGYGGGLARKRWLLRHEGVRVEEWLSH